MTQFRPNRHFIRLGGEGLRPLQILDVVDQHLDGLDAAVNLLVDLESFFRQSAVESFFGHRHSVEVVETVDEVLDTRAIGFDGGEDEEILQIGVPAEGTILKDDLFQQLDQLGLQFTRHKRTHGATHLVRVSTLGQRSANDLIDQRTTVGVDGIQHFNPQIHIRPLHNIARLQLEHGVLVRAFDQGIIALPTAVRDTSQIGVAALGVFSDNQRVIHWIGGEEMLGVVVGIDDDLAEGVMNVRVFAAFGDQVLQERRQQLQAIALLHFIDQLVHRE
mmetsp:Transcript_27639/g.51031  ORF Transcript_27639/g.51031 Transcript_27639/m.51031 type:complete len:275 (-) Transcript_27639:2660-3484(-)